MDFELAGNIISIEPIAAGSGIRDRKRLQKAYGNRPLAKMQALRQYASWMVRFTQRDPLVRAHGIGKKELNLLD